jgi:hypothetical protein
MYKGQTEYFNQVKAYLDAFDNVLVVLTEELRSNPKKVMQNVFKFLGVENINLDFNQTFNPSGIPRFKWIHHFLNQTNPLKSAISSVLSTFVSRKKLQEMGRTWRNKNIKGKLVLDDEEIKKALYLYYQPQILKLQDLIHKDLSVWMK